MKQIIFILIVSLLISCKKDKNESSPTTKTSPTYYTFSGEIGTNDNSTIVSSDNNLIICGNSNNNVSILKISKTGTQLWRKDIFAGFGSSASGVAESNSQELFICGYTSRNQSISMRDVLLIKTNSTGDTIWTKTYGGVKDDFGYQIIKTNDNNLLICGTSYSYTSEEFEDIYLIKVNTNGDTIWTRTYPEHEQQEPFHLMQTQNGEYLITGINDDNSSSYSELYLLKVSASGKYIWKNTIGPATWKWGFSTIELSNGDLLTCGQHTLNGFSQVLLIKSDNLGNKYWEKEFGDNNISEQGNSIKQNIDGTYTITGSSFDVFSGLSNIILIKVDQSGNQLWLNKFGNSTGDLGNNLIKDSNDDNIITGEHAGNIFMTKTDDNGVFK